MGMHWVYVIVGSVAGGCSRFVVAGAVGNAFGQSHPWGTFGVNLTGCLLIGVINAFAEAKLIGLEGRALLMTGFCGAYTTFSALILEFSQLLRAGQSGRAF